VGNLITVACGGLAPAPPLVACRRPGGHRRDDDALAREALRLADVRSGMTLRDVAAGGGALSIPAAELGADVLATDLSSGMLDLLRRRAEEAGVSGWPATRPNRMSWPSESVH